MAGSNQLKIQRDDYPGMFVGRLSMFLLQQEEPRTLTDVTLACEGRMMKAHKLVLAACSPHFNDLFAANPCKHPIVILNGVKIVQLQQLLDFLYTGSVLLSEDEAQGLIQLATTLNIKGLAPLVHQSLAVWRSTQQASPSVISTPQASPSVVSTPAAPAAAAVVQTGSRGLVAAAGSRSASSLNRGLSGQQRGSPTLIFITKKRQPPTFPPGGQQATSTSRAPEPTPDWAVHAECKIEPEEMLMDQEEVLVQEDAEVTMDEEEALIDAFLEGGAQQDPLAPQEEAVPIVEDPQEITAVEDPQDTAADPQDATAFDNAPQVSPIQASPAPPAGLSCEHCPFTTPHLKVLRKHIACLHVPPIPCFSTRLKADTCHKCPQTFRTPTLLFRHLHTAHQVQSIVRTKGYGSLHRDLSGEYRGYLYDLKHGYSCLICDRNYSKRSSCKKHEQKCRQRLQKIPRLKWGEAKFVSPHFAATARMNALIILQNEKIKAEAEKLHNENVTEVVEVLPTNVEIPDGREEKKINRSRDVGVKTCEVCHKEFKNGDSLRVHGYKYHKVKKTACPYCDAKYVLESRLQIHIKLRHSAE